MSGYAPSYDLALRRDTPLARKLIARIRRNGPIGVDDYMHACLNDPEFGYYRTRPAIGRDGDFITAPEISQVFGELIGLWCAVVWRQMGSPARLNLIELGAGRGTLLADALRAVRLVPAFRAAVSVHILDQNPLLIAKQRTVLADFGVPVAWHDALEALPADAPSIWVGNEFLDTQPVSQLVKHNGEWFSRLIDVDAAGQLTFAAPASKTSLEPGDDFFAVAPNDSLPDGALSEAQYGRVDVIHALRQRASAAPLAALFIDYGYVESAHIDTLQAVRDHKSEHVLTSPGEADLSCQVDFRAFASRASSMRTDKRLSFATDGPITQSEFLGRLGIMERASKLMAANPAKANTIETGVARLMAPQGMGTRFLALGVRSPGLPPLPGFEGAE